MDDVAQTVQPVVYSGLQNYQCFYQQNYQNFKIINSFIIKKLSELQNYQLIYYQEIIRTSKLSTQQQKYQFISLRIIR